MVMKNEFQAFKTMEEVMEANKVSGMYFFYTGNMDFFKSKVETELISSRWFIMSELDPTLGTDREFIIREVVDSSGRIKTIQREFKTLEDAQRAILKL